MYLRWPRVTALVSTTLVIIPGLADTDTSLVKVPSASESQFPPLKNISLSTCVEPEPARAGSDYIHRLSRVYFAFPVILTQGESRRLPRTRFRSQSSQSRAEISSHTVTILIVDWTVINKVVCFYLKY